MINEYSHYLGLSCACYKDIASAYPARYVVEHQRDQETIISRFTDEGVSFLTKTMPSLAKAIDKALATGTVLQVPNFARRRGSQLPNFLGWLIGQVFDTNGRELVSSNPVALMHLRQLLYLFYKLEMPYTDTQVSSVLEDFVSVDSGLNRPWVINEPTHVSEIKYAAHLVQRVLAGLDTGNLNPRHGPGSVATGEGPAEKPYFRRAYLQLEPLYPLDEYFYMNAGHLAERVNNLGLATYDLNTNSLCSWESLNTSTAKVVLVPKDSRGPRLISMEPLEIQWIQQGQCERLVKRFESHWLTRGHLNFTDQNINRYLAHVSSFDPLNPPTSWGPVKAGLSVPDTCALPKSHDLVTLDMKEASDRVSLSLIYTLFPSNWIEALEATRSSRTILPDGRAVVLNKFAPMGSAVCFPVEALCFWAIALSASMHHRPCSLSELRERVWVYGDDIICYREDYPVIKQSLERVGLMLNANKCCTAGFFRESCGLDAYKGVIVTPLRIKQRVSRSWTGQSVMAYVSYSNEAYSRGYVGLAQYIETILRSARVSIPYTTVDRGAVQFVRPYSNVKDLNRNFQVKMRYNKRLHYLEAYGPTPRAVITNGHRVTYETYFSKFVSKFNSNSEVNPPMHPSGSAGIGPDQYSVPRRVTSKRGWTQISL